MPKKSKRKLRYFVKDPHVALNKYLESREEIQAGRTRLHLTTPAAITVRQLVDRFLDSKRAMMESAELSPRTWRDYFATCKNLVEVFGRVRPIADLAGDDFERLRADLAKRRGPVSLGNEIQRVRTLFKFAFDEGIIDKPVRFGASFKKPSRKTIRKARHAAGPGVIGFSLACTAAASIIGGLVIAVKALVAVAAAVVSPVGLVVIGVATVAAVRPNDPDTPAVAQVTFKANPHFPRIGATSFSGGMCLGRAGRGFASPAGVVGAVRRGSQSLDPPYKSSTRPTHPSSRGS